MNAKKVCAILTVVMPVVALASLPAPTNLTVDTTTTAGTVLFDWDDVVGAVKYSLDLEGTVTYWTTVLIDEVETQVEATAEVELSFGTSDRTDGGLMGDSNLSLTIDEIQAAIAAELGVAVEDLIQIDGLVKVKALAPGKGAGPQNNPFSEPSSGVLVF